MTGHRYRYRTPALCGPWRESEDQAIEDAIGAKQAIRTDEVPEGWRWLLPGRIEQEEPDRGP